MNTFLELTGCCVNGIKKVLNRYTSVCLFFPLMVFFYAFPEFDVWVSRHFYRSDTHWFINKNVWVYAIYRFVPTFTWFVFFASSLFMVWAYKKSDYVRTRKISLFLFFSLILGPGLLVNVFFKETFDRPRPRAIQEFSGDKKHISAFSLVPSCNIDDCKSFVSGHASMGFFVMTFAWVFRRRRWLYLGIVSGLVVGGVRVMQGGHFLSDVIFSGFACYFLYRILSKIILGYSEIR